MKITPAAEMLIAAATVWLMLFSTMLPFFSITRSTPRPSIALTMLAGTVNPSFSPA